jgi:Flagellar hook protein FlgE
VQFAAATGVAGQSITLNFGGDGIARGLTQFDTDSTLISTQVDGAVFGALAGIEVSPSGEVIAQFANGITSTIAQIPLATFVNPDGLTAGPGGVFLTSPDSGPFNIQIAGTGAVGQIAGSTLEASNVDLASEFSGLIITQQAYTASARIISTADELLDELLQLAL